MKAIIGWFVSVLVGIFAFANSVLHAQSASDTGVEQYVREAWTVENGLAVGHVNQIYQTPDGYIWLATFKGLIRFDGQQFTLFDVSNTPELPSNRIVLLQPGQGNSFWLFTEQRDILHFENNTFKRHGSLLGIEHQRVLLDGDSLTWVTSQNGLRKLQNDTLVHTTFGELDSRNVLMVFRSQSGTLIITTISGEIYEATYPYENLSFLANLREPYSFRNLIEDKNRDFWTYNNFIRKITRKGVKQIDQKLVGQNGTTTDNWNGVSPLYYNLMEDNNGEKWVVSETGFFRLTDAGFERIQKYDHLSPEISERQGAGMCKCGD